VLLHFRRGIKRQTQPRNFFSQNGAAQNAAACVNDSFAQRRAWHKFGRSSRSKIMKNPIRISLTLASATGLMFLAAPATLGENPQPNPPAGAQPTALPAPGPQFSPTQKRQMELSAENAVREEELRKELADQTAELHRLKTREELSAAKFNQELAERRRALEKQKLEADEITAKLALENAKDHEAIDKELAKARAEKERAEMAASIAAAKAMEAGSNFKIRETELQSKISDLSLAMSTREKELQSKNYATHEPVYLDNPLQPDGTLVISDRRVSLNGVITDNTADYITSRINYFNNQNTRQPIFIVIDRSPGGSVMAGYNILKAMDSSEAPVYVVVKSFAASMAANIATQAKKSFTYPNAVILHHQILQAQYGNLTQQRESVKYLEQWWHRLAEPVAKKMGVTLDEFIKKMYEHVSTGDWEEFGDSAVKLHWIDNVVERIEETSLVRNPDDAQLAAAGQVKPQTAQASDTDEKLDENGKAYRVLPRLSPFDCYYLYNPDGYYRIK
jgi:ATP-dependent Clp protease protease subunit